MLAPWRCHVQRCTNLLLYQCEVAKLGSNFLSGKRNGEAGGWGESDRDRDKERLREREQPRHL
jgi:hypothetical protein